MALDLWFLRKARMGMGGLLCDVTLTRPTTDPAWYAMQGKHVNSASRRGGNFGITWVPASGLEVGSEAQLYGLASEVRNLCEMVTSMRAPHK